MYRSISPGAVRRKETAKIKKERNEEQWRITNIVMIKFHKA